MAKTALKAKPASLSKSTMMQVMSPLDANHYGYVHGGAIMRYVDEAAFVSASRHARRNVVTASMDHFDFIHPVHLGDLLILKSSVNYVGETSMEIGVRIESEDTVKGEVQFIGRAYVTMVALDDLGRPTPVPPLILETPLDKNRAKRAKERRTFRLKHRRGEKNGRKSS
ncbi:MAG: acyl-CoA thioesterase [Deltaproteobacteria bacterium]|nr:acyl-CoA thioesterase [Deltaproteobacteria bacterium]